MYTKFQGTVIVLLITQTILLNVSRVEQSKTMHQPKRLPMMFRLRDLGVPGLNSKAMSINDNCVVVGSIEPKTKSYHMSMVPNGFISLPTSYSIIKRVLPYSINNHNQIVGAWFSNNDLSMTRSVVLTLSRKKRLLTIPGGKTSSSAISINDNGTVLGYTTGDSIHGNGSVFIGKAHSLEFIPKYMSAVLRIMNITKINDSNTLSGTRYLPNGFQAVLMHGKSVSDLVLLSDCDSSSALDLNDKNQVVGFSARRTILSNATQQSGWLQVPTLWDNYKPTSLFHNVAEVDNIDLRGNAQASAINNNMIVVGRATDTFGKSCGFVWKKNHIYNLNYCLLEATQWSIIDASGINNHGQIIAWGERRVNGTDERHALLLEPCN